MEHNVNGVGHNASRNHAVDMEDDHLQLLLEKVDSTKEEVSAIRGELQAFFEDFRVKHREISETLAEIRGMVREVLDRNANRRDDRDGDDESDDSSSGEENSLGDVEDGMIIESDAQNDHLGDEK